jgi:hypothetical protein
MKKSNTATIKATEDGIFVPNIPGAAETGTDVVVVVVVVEEAG